MEHQKKLRLDGKLIGLWIGLTDLIRTVHAGSDRRVIGVIRLKERRNGQSAIQKRLEIIARTGIRLFGDQNIEFKNDVFIFHAFEFVLFDRVELPRNDKKNASGGDDILF